ncbi:ATP-binding cassette domain-containing protein [Carboxydothermus hydrogenoformans]|uniref:ATP-binding cassette domain-containing protein n=1 Tax=Carboxydothermus hydrogenoformans TaxID=129958 RepID=UPI000310779F|nr:ATP-binding cassette domain-containing protein [Carboxydothermus hydrogenoformans]
MGLEVKNLSVNYGGEPVLEDINFSLKEGDFLLVLGKNGAGKSTLLKAIVGEIPYFGIIKTFNHKIGYVAQKIPGTIPFPVTVEELVLARNAEGKTKIILQ